MDLLWQLTNGPLQVAQPSPAVNSGFLERRCCHFQLPSPAWKLRIDDAPLPAGTWTPGFYAGEVTAELLNPLGQRQALYLFDVSPDPTKLGRDIFAQIIADLRAADPELLLGLEPATAPLGATGTIEDPWVAFARLRRHVPAFLSALVPLRQFPRHVLHAQRQWRTSAQVRRVDRLTVLSASRGTALSLSVPSAQESLDSAANRAIAKITAVLAHRARSLLTLLAKKVAAEPSSPTRTALADRWPARRHDLEQLASAIELAQRAAPLSHVTRPEITAAGLTAVAADPFYARVWGQAWRALRPGLQSDDTTERLWTSPTWELYERWCLLELGRRLAIAFPLWNWHATSPRRWAGTGDGCRAELLAQLHFPAGSSPRLRCSVSRLRIPDIVFRITRNDHQWFLVFDAKYRATRSNVLDAMGAAHIYQDSLRWHQSRPEASILLVPAGGGAPWLELPAFHDEHRVGVEVLAPGDSSSLPHALLQLLDQVSSA